MVPPPPGVSKAHYPSYTHAIDTHPCDKAPFECHASSRTLPIHVMELPPQFQCTACSDGSAYIPTYRARARRQMSSPSAGRKQIREMEKGEAAKVVRSKPGTVKRVVYGDEEGRHRVEKVAMPETRHPDTLRYMERKLSERGMYRMERHPVDGLTLKGGPPKSGRGGKYTWEGPDDVVHSQLDPAPAAIDEGDPNYEPLTGEGDEGQRAEEKNGPEEGLD